MHRIRAVTIVLAVAQVALLSAQQPPCMFAWQTPKNDGSISDAADSGTDLGIKCQPSLLSQCQGGPNARCAFSFRTSQYICCHDVWLASALTILSNTNNMKPSLSMLSVYCILDDTCSLMMHDLSRQGWDGCDFDQPSERMFLLNCSNSIGGKCGDWSVIMCSECPNGGIAQGGNIIYVCNPLKPNACEQDYACTRSANATSTSSRNPYLCCKTSTLSSYSKVFSDLGFTPKIVPIAPADPIYSITFDNGVNTANAFVVSQGDNWSHSVVKAKFIGASSGVAFAPTFVSSDIVQVPGDKYHLLIFDANDKKHVLLFQTDITGGAATDTSLSLATGSKLIVYPWNFKNASYPSGFQWANTYEYGPADYPLRNSSPEKYIALLFTTGTTTIANLGIDVTTETGTFGPNQGGLHNMTITEFLRSEEGSKLGSPIAGMYFYI